MSFYFLNIICVIHVTSGGSIAYFSLYEQWVQRENIIKSKSFYPFIENQIGGPILDNDNNGEI